jgi:hypothetical protein
MKSVKYYMFILIILCLGGGCIQGNNKAGDNNLYFNKSNLSTEKKQLSKSGFEEYSYYTDGKGDKIKHGFYSKYTIDLRGMLRKERAGIYIDGKESGVWIFNNIYNIQLLNFREGKVELIEVCNSTGEVISTLKIDEKGSQGTFWNLGSGLNGIKFSTIEKYKDNQKIDEVRCDEDGYEIAEVDKIEFKNELAYKKKDDSLFTGVMVTYYDDFEFKTKQFFKDGKPVGGIEEYDNKGNKIIKEDGTPAINK